MGQYFGLAIAYLILFAISFWAARRKPFDVLSIWLLVLLGQELIIRWLSNLTTLPGTIITGISLWKEIVLAALVLVVLLDWYQHKSEHRLRIDLFSGSLIAIVVVGVISLLTSPDRVRALAALRDYLEPMVVLGVTIALRPTRQQVERWLWAWVVLGVLMAALGILQAASWDSADYVRWGFGEPSGQIGIPSASVSGERYIRPPSSVTGPNELSMHMSLLSLFTLAVILEAQSRRKLAVFVVLALFLACLFLTLSRSTLAGLLLGAGILFFLYRKEVILRFKAHPGIFSIILVVGFAAMVALVAKTGIFIRIVDTVRNLSQEYHVKDMVSAIQFLVVHPAGVGMGFVGPRQGVFFSQPAKFSVEGSVFQIAMEMGVWGLALWILFWVIGLRKMLYNLQDIREGLLRVILSTAITGWVTAFVVFLFLPMMQSLTLMAWLWFFFGLGINSENLRESWASPPKNPSGSLHETA